MNKEYKKGNVAIEIDKDAVYIRRVSDTMTDHLFLSMQHLIDLQDLINQILETPTVKEPTWKGFATRNIRIGDIVTENDLSSKSAIESTPPSNSEKEECCEKCIPNFKIEFTGECPLFKICMKPDCPCHKEEVKEDEWPEPHLHGFNGECLTGQHPPKEDIKKEEPVKKPRKINIVGLEMAGRSRDDIRYIIVDTVNDIIDYLDETK